MVIVLLLKAPNYNNNVNKIKSFQLLWLIYYIVFYFTYTEVCIQLHYYRYHKIKQQLYTILLIYFNQDHRSEEQLFIIVLLLKALNYVDIAYCTFCTTLRVLIKPTIVNFSTITEIPELSNYR